MGLTEVTTDRNDPLRYGWYGSLMTCTATYYSRQQFAFADHQNEWQTART